MKNIYITLLLFYSLSVTGQLSISPVQVSNITQSGFILSWENSDEADSYIRYGNTPDLELGILSAGTTNSPQVTISDANPAELFYAQAVANDGNEEAASDTLVFITASASSGEMLVYFNQSVNHAYASEENEAIVLDELIDDTLVAYFGRAQETIDVAIYNTTSSSSVADYSAALNEAHNNGVRVRVIYNGSTSNTAIPDLHPDIERLESPEPDFPDGHGLMHHKFFIFDAHSSNPDLPIVWTGSTNLTTQQINTDANHVVITQDQSLAMAYTMEFEEMWGGSGDAPDLQNSRFGPFKTDNTPHHFNINGKHVECYFSPSDGVNDRIAQAINEAEDDLIVNTMLITRNDLADAIIDRFNAGVQTGVLVNTITQTSTFNTLEDAIGGSLAEYSSVTGMLHHKAMFANAISGNNPYVLTGSHNWSSSAELRNDENTLIIHDEKIANLFLQEFMQRFEPIVQPYANDDYASASTGSIEIIDVAQNDDLYLTTTPFTSITIPPHHGMASGSSSGNIAYLPDDDFSGQDSLMYTICNQSLFDYCDSAWVYLDVVLSVSERKHHNNSHINVYPNPTQGSFNVESDSQINLIQLMSMDGRLIQSFQNSFTGQHSFTLNDELSKGIYLLKIASSRGNSITRLVIN